jgi:TRAP-type C4-dicarboxylate transport system permease small subunit
MESEPSRIIASEEAQGTTSSEAKNMIQRVLGAFCFILVGGTVVLLSAQVAVRQLGWGSLVWSGEMATWLFSWTSFMGAVLVYMEKKHIVIDFLTSFLPRRVLKILDYFHQVTMMAVLITLLVTGIRVTSLYANQSATSIDISKAFLFVSLPVACALMIGWTIAGWIRGR